MGALEDFEKILKEVVDAKRLSASKMNALTEIAMKNMGNDTQLVSILYRTHKSLPTVSKVSSLYIFDALSRAAKHHVVKHGITGDDYTQPGNCATFLLKVGGVVEGLFQDMVTSGSSESKKSSPEVIDRPDMPIWLPLILKTFFKAVIIPWVYLDDGAFTEKTKKILDIWVKGNTFPPAILSQLSNILKPTDKVLDPTPAPTIDPRINVQPAFNPPATVQSSLTPPLDPQAALLALLTQAAATSGNLSSSQMIANVGASPQLDATQLAVLQQLAHTAASVPSVSQNLPLPEPVNVQKFPSSSGVSGSSHSPPSSHRDEPHNMAKKEQRYNRFRSPESELGLNPHFDLDSKRGKYRGGLRSRGRGDHLTHKWDNRDRDSYRTSERDRSPPRGGRSRSRSPSSRYGGRRSSRFSQRTRFASPSQGQESLQGSTAFRTENDSGKDEFGRDVRPQSPQSKSPSVARETPLPAPSSPTTIIKPRVESRSSLAVTTNLDQKSVSPLVTADDAASNKPSAPLVSNTVPYSGLGMDSFDLSTFDYTSPTSWEALGKMWQVTNGYLPSTEQLIQFVISCGTGQMSFPELSNGNQQQSAESWEEEQFSGSGFPYGNGRNMHKGSDTTNAIVLGGDDINSPQNASISSCQKTTPTLQESQTSNSSSGRMQKVGDKWVFVRGSTTDVS